MIENEENFPIIFLQTLIDKIKNNTITKEELIAIEYLRISLQNTHVSSDEKELRKYLTAGYVFYNMSNTE